MLGITFIGNVDVLHEMKVRQVWQGNLTLIDSVNRPKDGSTYRLVACAFGSSMRFKDRLEAYLVAEVYGLDAMGTKVWIPVQDKETVDEIHLCALGDLAMNKPGIEL